MSSRIINFQLKKKGEGNDGDIKGNQNFRFGDKRWVQWKSLEYGVEAHNVVILGDIKAYEAWAQVMNYELSFWGFWRWLR